MSKALPGLVRYGAFLDEEFHIRYGAKRLVLITSREVASITGYEDILQRAETKIDRIYVPDGERQKDISVVNQVMDELSALKFPRDGLIVALGGGATTDLAGFAASIWMRGVDWVAIPTTLAAMVDAAIGGKTGVNLDSGKNLVGAFHLPLETIVDIHQLRTLSRRDVAAGLAEVIKCGMIADPKILELAEQSSLDEIIAGRNEDVLQDLIGRAIAVKQSFVAKDLRESGVRAFLNYGHTLAHAIEVAEDFSLRHGEAVALGMVFAAELSRRILGLDADAVQRQRSLLEQFELPTETINTDFSTIFAIMKRDKKVLGDRMRFVLLRSIGEPELNSAIDEEILESVYQELFVKP